MKFDVYAKETVYYKIPVEAKNIQFAIDKVLSGKIPRKQGIVVGYKNFQIDGANMGKGKRSEEEIMRLLANIT